MNSVSIHCLYARILHRGWIKLEQFRCIFNCSLFPNKYLLWRSGVPDDGSRGISCEFVCFERDEMPFSYSSIQIRTLWLMPTDIDIPTTINYQKGNTHTSYFWWCCKRWLNFLTYYGNTITEINIKNRKSAVKIGKWKIWNACLHHFVCILIFRFECHIIIWNEYK